jgi:hypothetical protein
MVGIRYAGVSMEPGMLKPVSGEHDNSSTNENFDVV